jgi:hypothetical protein
MKHCVISLLAAAFIAGQALATPTDTAIVAAMKLADQPNYSWTATVVRDSRSYTVEGKTSVGGYTQVIVPANVAMPANPDLRGRVGRGSTDSNVTAIFKGNEIHVVETSEGWMTPAELASLPPAPRSGSGRRRGLVTDLPLSFAISLPHEDIGIIIGSSADLKVDGGIVSGRLSDTGAKLLLLPPGQENVTPELAFGTFKLWITEGALTKYEVQLTGTVAITAGKNRRVTKTTQTSTTELKDIGSTKFTVPPEAKAKLD